MLLALLLITGWVGASGQIASIDVSAEWPPSSHNDIADPPLTQPAIVEVDQNATLIEMRTNNIAASADEDCGFTISNKSFSFPWNESELKLCPDDENNPVENVIFVSTSATDEGHAALESVENCPDRRFLRDIFGDIDYSTATYAEDDGKTGYCIYDVNETFSTFPRNAKIMAGFRHRPNVSETSLVCPMSLKIGYKKNPYLLDRLNMYFNDEHMSDCGDSQETDLEDYPVTGCFVNRNSLLIAERQEKQETFGGQRVRCEISILPSSSSDRVTFKTNASDASIRTEETGNDGRKFIIYNPGSLAPTGQAFIPAGQYRKYGREVGNNKITLELHLKESITVRYQSIEGLN